MRTSGFRKKLFTLIVTNFLTEIALLQQLTKPPLSPIMNLLFSRVGLCAFVVFGKKCPLNGELSAGRKVLRLRYKIRIPLLHIGAFQKADVSSYVAVLHI